MPKEFYTERDIVDMFKGGIMSLEVNDNVALTEMAYEKARSLGMKLVRDRPDNPPSARVRPYISKEQSQRPATPAPAPVISAVPSSKGGSAADARAETSLEQRIRDAVFARLGSQVDSNLLDVIIKRVLASTGVK
jgi:hypothetical protein